MKIRSWDKVIVKSWKSKDRWVESEVLKVFTDNNKIIVKGINIATKHIKKQWTNPWQIIKIERPINVSNVMLVCPFTKKPTRIGYVNIETKWKTKKFRFSKKAVKDNSWKAKDFIIK
jgi:large subunit ribosomal protein L24